MSRRLPCRAVVSRGGVVWDICPCLYFHVDACVCACFLIYLYIFIYTYTHLHTHIHTHLAEGGVGLDDPLQELRKQLPHARHRVRLGFGVWWGVGCLFVCVGGGRGGVCLFVCVCVCCLFVFFPSCAPPTPFNQTTHNVTHTHTATDQKTSNTPLSTSPLWPFLYPFTWNAAIRVGTTSSSRPGQRCSTSSSTCYCVERCVVGQGWGVGRLSWEVVGGGSGLRGWSIVDQS